MVSSEQTKSNFLAAGALLNTLMPVVEEFGRSAPLTYVVTFLHVATTGSGGIDQGELAKRLALPPAAAIRAVQALGEWSWVKGDDGQKRPGLGLITSLADPRGDARRRVVALTPKGEKLMHKLATKMEKQR